MELLSKLLAVDGTDSVVVRPGDMAVVLVCDGGLLLVLEAGERFMKDHIDGAILYGLWSIATVLFGQKLEMRGGKKRSTVWPFSVPPWSHWQSWGAIQNSVKLADAPKKAENANCAADGLTIPRVVMARECGP